MAQPGRAAETFPQFNQTGTYRFTWNGIPFGLLQFTATEAGGRFSAQSAIRATGVVRAFSAHESKSSVSGVRSGSYGQSARTYETHYTSKGKPRHIKLVYAADGELSEEIVEPLESKEKRPEVTPEQKRGAPDPLSYVYAVREALHDALENGRTDFRVPLYDGKRRLDTDYTVAGRVELKGKPNAAAIEIVGHRIPVAGFTAKELANIKNDPPLHAFFSDDGKLSLLALRVDTWLGALEARLE